MMKEMLEIKPLRNPVPAQLAHYFPFPQMAKRRSLAPRNGLSKTKTKTEPDPWAFQNHPLARTKAVTVRLEWDGTANAWVTQVKGLGSLSTFGATEQQALDRTQEMILGYLKSAEANGFRIRLSAERLTALKRAVGLK
jgi:predicted RNase H-like HicB family nuclease